MLASRIAGRVAGTARGILRPVERLTTYEREVLEIPSATGDFTLAEVSDELIDEMAARFPDEVSPWRAGALRGDRESDVERWIIVGPDGRAQGWCHLVMGRGPNTRIRHTLVLDSTTGYLYDAHVLTPYRGAGAHQFSILARLERIRALGGTVAVTTISDTNLASIASFRKLGFMPRSRLLFLRPLRRSVERPLRP